VVVERKGRSVVWLGMYDLLHKLDGPDQWWFAPLIGGAYATIVLALAYYVAGV
jgi:hypothetical protein